jgi:5-methylcytosine-specific restriction endonuclease McrA
MNTIRAKHPRLRLPPESYEQLCLEIFRRDGWRCQACGSFTNLQIHHKELRSRSGDDSEDNLITLCSICHESLHRS